MHNCVENQKKELDLQQSIMFESVSLNAKVAKKMIPLIVATLSFAQGNMIFAENDNDTPVQLIEPGDKYYSTACGPIALYVSLLFLDIPIELEEAVTLCDWKQGQLTSLETIVQALSTFEEIKTESVVISIDELYDYLAHDNQLAILATKKKSENVNHAVAALHAQGDAITLLDYPDLLVEGNREELQKIWDGLAILIKLSEPTDKKTKMFSNRNVLILCLLLLMIAANYIFSRWKV